MHLVLVENAEEKATLYGKFLDNLQRAWPRESRNRTVVYPMGKKEVDVVIHNDRWSLAHWESDSRENNRTFKNYFSPYEEKGDLQTALEINISIESEKRAGFFARSNQDGAFYLMHSGRINIQGHAVTAAQFLDWLERQGKPVGEASCVKGKSPRRGAVVARLDSETVGEDVAGFIETVTGFKGAVRTGKVKL
ncbi:MAG: hypothetical protein ACYYKD_02860 [Rhodospirillales bacterium]